ncbi:maleate cis-trans isomerase family protein [Phycobacter azelaicus]|uniref:maleate cis-trans isomerase family protein n=1 Tax=Phycobacter azelaicus TaxID=2668075 RepID=UPI0018661EF6|nr:aspartate/glutamate racemase family protein [Phycobacter azelaicus]MBE1296355.1 Asp/Glu racemase [Paracoccaceae bacterium]
MQHFPYDLTGPIGSRATLGLIVLQVDETLEQDMRRLLPGGDVAHHVTRIPSGDALTPDTIATMEGTLPAAAALLPPAAAFDVIGYGCTSGTTLIGADRVADLVRQGAASAHVTDPLSAALAALESLGIQSLAIVSPYVDSVSAPVRDAFAAQGYEVRATASFGEEVEARVARIDPASIRAAALSVADDADAVFLSCTNLRTLDIIEDLEAVLGKPVLSSNQVLAWHMAKLAKISEVCNGPGHLFQTLPV